MSKFNKKLLRMIGVRSRLIILLIIIVLLPGILFGWLINQYNHKEQNKQSLILKEVAKSRLNIVDLLIQNALVEQQRYLTLILSRSKGSNTELNGHDLISGKFVISQNGEWLLPDTSQSSVNSKNEQVLKLKNHLDDHTLLYSDSYFMNVPETSGNLWDKINVSLRQGWYLWDVNGETQLVFWFETRSKQIIGAIINKRQLELYLVEQLKDLDLKEFDHDLLTVRDNANQVIFQKGKIYSAAHGGISEQAQLSPPLQNWTVSYSIQEDLWGHLYGKYQAFVFTLVFILFSGFIVFYLYREQHRETTLAQQQMNFVNQVTHELQTPLTNIRMYSELMEEQIDEDQLEQKRFMTVISEESQRLSRLIDNILNMARSDNNALVINMTNGHVEDVIDKCVNLFLPILEKQYFEIEYDFKSYPGCIFDPDALEQILNNLISNVEKYAVSGHYLKIEHEFNGGKTIIRIYDKGPGIAVKDEEKVFTPFYRISNKLDEGVSGLGIGLDIVRQLARLHGGDVRLMRLKQGCCFEVILSTPLVGERI